MSITCRGKTRKQPPVKLTHGKPLGQTGVMQMPTRRSALLMDADESRRVAESLNAESLHDPALIVRLAAGELGEVRVWELGDGLPDGVGVTVVWSLTIPAGKVAAVRSLIDGFLSLVKGVPFTAARLVLADGLDARRSTLVRLLREIAREVTAGE